MNKKLIIASPHQFGYNISIYHYCKYLKNNFDVCCICWDQNLPKLSMENINVIYVKRTVNSVSRNIYFLSSLYKEIVPGRTIVLVRHFMVLSFILGVLKPVPEIFIDIRTGSVAKKKIKRKVQDTWLRAVTLFYKNITIISESLANKLKISNKAQLLPLGADVISKTDKNFDELNLLYVGTLYNRNIETTIMGFKKFLDYIEHENAKKIRVTYTIIGSGSGNEENKLYNLINKLELTGHVCLTGYVPYPGLKKYFDNSNIGISFVPLADYFEVQPPTKTFEYLLSGMPVIATATLENKKIINPDNGVLIEDTCDDFFDGLKIIFKTRSEFNSRKIRDESLKYSWSHIINDQLIPFLTNI